MIVVVILVFIVVCDGGKLDSRVKKSKDVRGWKNSQVGGEAFKNGTSNEQGRGFASSKCFQSLSQWV